MGCRSGSIAISRDVLETGIGGVKSPKIRGGVKIFKFRGSRNLTLFCRDSIENPQFGGQKSKLSKEDFRGEFPPPSSVRYVLTPPYPGLWPLRSQRKIHGKSKNPKVWEGGECLTNRSEHNWLKGKLHREKKKNVHDHHRKKIIWGTFLASKKNFPGRWWIQEPMKKPGKNHIYHRNSFLCAPHVSRDRKVFCTGAGRCMLSFSQLQLAVGFFMRSWCWDTYFDDRRLRTILAPGQKKPKSAVDTRKTPKKQRFR